jgi:mercuric ion transport protein
MIDDTHKAVPDAAPARNTGAFLLAAGGVAAAFGTASCCALPLLLGSLGIGSAWLVAVAWFAAPHRLALLGIAVACLGAGGSLLLWRRRRVAGCPSGACGSPVTTSVVTSLLLLGGVLVVLGWMFA